MLTKCSTNFEIGESGNRQKILVWRESKGIQKSDNWSLSIHTIMSETKRGSERDKEKIECINKRIFN